MLRKINRNQQNHWTLSSRIRILIKLMRIQQVQLWLHLKMLIWRNQLLMRKNQKPKQRNQRNNLIHLIMIFQRLKWREQEMLTPLIWSTLLLLIPKNLRLLRNQIPKLASNLLNLAKHRKIKRRKQLRTPIRKNLSICRGWLTTLVRQNNNLKKKLKYTNMLKLKI